MTSLRASVSKRKPSKLAVGLISSQRRIMQWIKPRHCAVWPIQFDDIPGGKGRNLRGSARLHPDGLFPPPLPSHVTASRWCCAAFVPCMFDVSIYWPHPDCVFSNETMWGLKNAVQLRWLSIIKERCRFPWGQFSTWAGTPEGVIFITSPCQHH